MSIQEKIKGFIAERNGLIEKLRVEGEQWTRDLLLMLMEAYPEVSCIYWQGYAPYFNDGEECTFGFREVCVHGAEFTQELLNEYDGDLSAVFEVVCEDGRYESSLESAYCAEHEVDSHGWRGIREYTGGTVETREKARKLGGIEEAISGAINEVEEVLKITLGDPQEVLCVRVGDKVHVQFSYEVDHD